MKAAVLYADADIRYEEVPTPQPAAGEVLVRVKTAGICGSDVPRVLRGGAHYYPIILGHEFAGEIAAVGADVRDLAVGDRVTGAPLLPCFSCPDCERGNYSLCRNYTFIGSRLPGAFAEYVVLPARNAVRFDKSVPYRTAAFFEPSTVALHGLYCADYREGGDVAILGGGTVGMFAFQWARILGARSVTVFDISQARLELAASLGATYTFNTLCPDFEETVRARFPRGFDYVFETAGQTATEKLAFRLCGNRAKICFIGTPTKPLTLAPEEVELINRKEFLLTGSWMSYSAPFPGREWEMTARYFSRGELKISDRFVYREYPLSQAREAFLEFREPKNVTGKILLVND